MLIPPMQFQTLELHTVIIQFPGKVCMPFSMCLRVFFFFLMLRFPPTSVKHAYANSPMYESDVISPLSYMSEQISDIPLVHLFWY